MEILFSSRETVVGKGEGDFLSWKYNYTKSIENRSDDGRARYDNIIPPEQEIIEDYVTVMTLI